MAAGKLYDPGDPEILKEQTGYLAKMYEFNRTLPSE
ncbi:maltose acetyltransferase domain-containing protein, partial [Klebsiella pneumoniae]